MDVSVATVRRDLEQLESEGHVIRVFGGAVAPDDLSYAPRSQSYVLEKRRIAERAAALVSPGEAVALDTGTTVVAVARCLRSVRGIAIATNSIDAALALEGVPDLRAVLCGGIFEPVTHSLYGPLVESFYQAHRVDKLFIGAGSVGREGVRDSNVAALGAKQAAMRAAARTIVVADHSKFGGSALVLVAGWSAVQTLVTDDAAPPDVLDLVRSLGVDVIVA